MAEIGPRGAPPTKAQIEAAVEELRAQGGLGSAGISEEFYQHLAASNTWDELRSKALQAGLPESFVQPVIEKVIEDTAPAGPMSMGDVPLSDTEYGPPPQAGYESPSGQVNLTEAQMAAVASGGISLDAMVSLAREEMGLGPQEEEGPYVDQSAYLGLQGIDPVSHFERLSSPDFGYGFRRGDYGSGTPYLSVLPLYQSGSEVGLWAQKSPLNQRYWTNEMERAGLLVGGQYETIGEVNVPDYLLQTGTPEEIEAYKASHGEVPTMSSYSAYEQMQAFREVLGVANFMGITPELAVRQIRTAFDNANRAAARSGGGGGYVKQPFSVPAALRTVPDYETLKQNVTTMMRQTMGRDPEDWEVVILADDLLGEHETYNEQMIKAAKDAYDNNRSLENIEVPDPTTKTQRFLEERYAPEMGRLQDIDEASQSNQLMINALTKGANMVGGR